MLKYMPESSGPGADRTTAPIGDPNDHAARAGVDPALSPVASGPIGDSLSLLQAGWRVNRRLFCAQALSLTTSGLIGGISLAMLIPIVNSLSGTEQHVLRLPLVGTVTFGELPVGVLLAAFMLLIIMQSLIVRSGTINRARYRPLIVDHLRQQAFEAVLAARWTFFLTRRRSDITTTISTGAESSGQAFTELVKLLTDSVLFLVTAAVALIVSPAVTMIALCGVAILGLLQGRALRDARALGRRSGKSALQLQGVMRDSLDSIRLVRAHDSAQPWAKLLSEAIERNREVQVSSARRMANVTAASNIALAGAACVLILICLALDVPTTSIAVLLVLMMRLSRLAQGLGSTAAQLAFSLPQVHALAKFTALATTERDIPAAPSTRRAGADDSGGPLIELRNVTYHYPGTKRGVVDLSLAVPAGRITVITGDSGAGKSTTLDLILGLLPPDSGEVLIGGTPLVSEDLAWWRSQVAYVPQETVLVPATLRENLVWSVPGGASDEACWHALDQAAAEFARKLPRGLDTPLGDHGMRLSGGERQRISIARALLRTPQLLVLDEATSSLDDATEAAVLDSIGSLTDQLTPLIVAHRRSTIEAGDHVIRLADGRLRPNRPPAIPQARTAASASPASGPAVAAAGSVGGSAGAEPA